MKNLRLSFTLDAQAVTLNALEKERLYLVKCMLELDRDAWDYFVEFHELQYEYDLVVELIQRFEKF